MPLFLVAAGETVIVQQTGGSTQIRQRLVDLGLTRGAELHMLKNDPASPLLIALNHDSRLALDRRLAHHILVSLPDTTA
ncbi:MAG: ferrous iron transport protein A [Chloroflexi bacterium]|nr:ferrous iron transport protein A [Chloroflexota bacterium]